MKNIIEIHTEKKTDEWVIPHNKSFANRALVIAALTKKVVTLKNIPMSSDVQTMLDCFRAIGIDFEMTQNNDAVRIHNSFLDADIKRNQSSDPLDVFCGDGGTTTRFLMALLARGSSWYCLRPSLPMQKRPMKGLVQALVSLGAEIVEKKIDGDLVFYIKGPLREGPKTVEIDCSQTTQFLSAVLLVTHDLEVEVSPINIEGSYKYIEQTKDLINIFDSKILNVQNTEEIIVEIPVDSSSLSYPLVLGALRPPLKVLNCTQLDPMQADSVFVEILKACGLNIDINAQGLKIDSASKNLRPLDIDASGFPDLAPTLCLLASYIEGVSVIRNIGSLRFKECDRLAEMMKILKLFNIEVTLFDDVNLRITGVKGPSQVKSIEYQAPDDHRMIMIVALFMLLNSGGKISNYEHVKKSFPNYFSFLDSK